MLQDNNGYLRAKVYLRVQARLRDRVYINVTDPLVLRIAPGLLVARAGLRLRAQQAMR